MLWGLSGAGIHGMCAGAGISLLGWAEVLRRKLREESRLRRQFEGMCEEIYAYALVDLRLAPGEDEVVLAKRVCRALADKSAFRRSAVLVRDGDGRMTVAGSVGVDDLTVGALDRWGETLPDGTLVNGRMSKGMEAALGRRLSRGSFALQLERRRSPARGALDPTQMGCKGMVAVPLWTGAGKLAGVLAVCADGQEAEGGRTSGEMLLPVEALATKLARTIENRQLTDRLLRAEKLAGLGQLAGGVAHALNNPLTAVMGYSELMADSAADGRVRAQAGIILGEAKRMQETVQSLLSFWRPETRALEPVQVARLLEELEDACASKLESRGVRLVIQAGESMPPVRASRERLREALEHLLNNAAQAIATAQACAPKEQGAEAEHVIRLTANLNAGALHLIVSDTGPGFKEPRKVFDPFYTTQEPGGGAGLGLSICYGIAREHGGEISAFNLHPRGAAVLLELPVREAVAGPEQVVMSEVA